MCLKVKRLLLNNLPPAAIWADTWSEVILLDTKVLLKKRQSMEGSRGAAMKGKIRMSSLHSCLCTFRTCSGERHVGARAKSLRFLEQRRMHEASFHGLLRGWNSSLHFLWARRSCIHFKKMFFSFGQHHSFFPLKQGFQPAVLVFQPLVYRHDIPVSAAAAHSECHQLLSFPALLESCEEIIFLGLVWGPPQPCALWQLVLYLPCSISSQVEPGGQSGTTGQFSYAINVSLAFDDAPSHVLANRDHWSLTHRFCLLLPKLS